MTETEMKLLRLITDSSKVDEKEFSSRFRSWVFEVD